MRRASLVLGAVACTWLLGLTFARAAGEAPSGWNAKAAATYLDDELAWWASWPNATRDHGTFCVSCHTATPYVLARPALAEALGETGPSAASHRLFENVATRVRLWREVEPWYPDQTRGLPKSSESRGTESVLNALVLATRDARTGTLADDTRLAFSHMWAQQMKTGPLDGAWACAARSRRRARSARSWCWRWCCCPRPSGSGVTGCRSRCSAPRWCWC